MNRIRLFLVSGIFASGCTLFEDVSYVQFVEEDQGADAGQDLNNYLFMGVGSPCTSQVDCEGYCSEPGALGIPGGYCTKLCNSAGTDCPDGSHCGLVDSASGFGICLRSCEEESDCRREGFGCFDNDLDRAKECWPLANGDGELADPCQSTNDCSGGPGAFCLSPKDGYLGGYCSKDCSANSDCGENGTCLGEVLCVAKECNGREEGYREYVIPDFEPEQFCWLAGTAAVGDSCEVFFECEGEDPFCVTELPDGYCSRSCENNADCGVNARCTDVLQRTDPICAATCLEDADCRDGYRCSLRAPTVDRTEARFCVPGLRE